MPPARTGEDGYATVLSRVRPSEPTGRALVVVLVALISLVVPISPAEASVPGPQRTTVVMFPWQADGKLAPQVHVGPPISGYCWTGAFPPPDDQYAWRCLSGNSILTPCFSRLPVTRARSCAPCLRGTASRSR